jgi:hypothetical protein
VTTIYKVDSRNQTYGELWRTHRPRVNSFLVVALCKLLRIPMHYGFGIRRPEAIHRLEPAALPPLVLKRLEPVVRACAGPDLALQFYGSSETGVNARAKGYTAALLDADGLFWAQAVTALSWSRGVERVTPLKFVCYSLLTDDRYVVTSGHEWTWKPLAGDRAEFLAGAAPEVVVALHRRRIAQPVLRLVAVRPDELEQVMQDRNQLYFDRQVERGVYVPMTAKELRRLNGST